VSLENQSKVEQLVALHEWLNDACSRGAVPVLTGKNGDMDTIGSAIALSSINSNMMAGGLHLRITFRTCCQKGGKQITSTI